MASISELCRGLYVPSIEVTPTSSKHIIFRFIYPFTHYKEGFTRFNFESRPPYMTTPLNKWVKLSHSLERKMNGYVSIKLIFYCKQRRCIQESEGGTPFFNFIFSKVNGQTFYYLESIYVCKPNFSIFCQYMTFCLCFQYIWTYCVDGRCYKNMRPEHKPVVYKDVQVYLGKENSLNHNPAHKAWNKEGYVPAAQGSHQS